MRTPFMEEALELARRGVGVTSPNPAVGAVVVRDGRVVGRGSHTWAGVKHAEILALEEAGQRSRGADLYVTLEPCSHHGRTPPCTEAIRAAGVARVFAAMRDPNPLMRGGAVAVEYLPEYEAEAASLNEAFLHAMRTGKPLVTLKAALTLDGKISAPDDNSGWITSERARAHVQEIRHHADAILTGIGTVLADDCRLTDRTGRDRSRPLLRLVLDSTLRLPLESRLVAGARGDVAAIATSAASPARRKALEDRGVMVITLDGPGGRADLAGTVAWLAEQQYRSLLIEAGSKVNWAALEARIVDKIFFYYAPKILGGMQSLPVAGGSGRRRRVDAIRLTGVKLHPIPPDEFAVEARVAD